MIFMVKDPFNENVKWNLEQVAVLVGHAESVKTRARSGYYKSAIMLASSVVEALAFKVLEKNSSLAMPLGDLECTRSNILPQIYKSDMGERLSICERKRKRFVLGRQTDFKKVNEVCFILKLFKKRLFNNIEKIRKLRNKIHIQSIGILDRSYTKKELEFISSVLLELYKKV
jgi:hypothetical protein